MQELQTHFAGRGETKGFLFTQLEKTEKGYIYLVTDASGKKWYEVFNRKENTQFGCISYPTAKAFGLWAWTLLTREASENKLNSF